ncbi:phospholipase D-like domain-containing protein [Candidatus Bipolaricaulota bacterium]
MGLAREIVELAAQIRDYPDVDLFAPIESSGLLSVPEFVSLIGQSTATTPAEAVRLCLQALRIQRAGLESRLLDAELVATLPRETPRLARPTERVVYEMIARAASEIVLLGYELTDAALIGLLSEARKRGADVIVICDRNRGTAQRIRRIWPGETSHPRLFHDRERINDAPYASMHAKCLLVDGRELLITSANFTFHGLHGNIEIGVRIKGTPAVEARKIFSHLVETRILEEIAPLERT